MALRLHVPVEFPSSHARIAIPAYDEIININDD